jgi:MYXO-CTERM domain-containing protein
MRRRTSSLSTGLLALTVTLAPAIALAWTPKTAAIDPLVRMPGTQPTQGVNVQGSNACTNCHAGYDANAEPGFSWKGSMMAQSARDPFFWATMTVAAQDSIYALGRPNGTDLCERCHVPKGWLELRSDPTNGSAFGGFDFDGVQCDFCHKALDPFFADTHAGTREGMDWQGYFDEANINGASQMEADNTYADDVAASASYRFFDGTPLYDQTSHLPAGFDEVGSGQYFIAPGVDSRGPYADSGGPHGRRYSRYHKSKYFCSTCHDVSNTALENLAYANASINDGTTVLPSEVSPAHSYFPIERTFSEFILSDFGLDGGALGEGAFAPAVFDTTRPNNAIAGCQDCHMPITTGKSSTQKNSPIRPTPEHPSTGVAKHEMSGGNAFITYVLASTVAGSPVFDATNAMLLGQGSNKITLDLAAGTVPEAAPLIAGSNRAVAELGKAAAIQNLTYDRATGAATFRIKNYTGHKLISGYPEGRRMFARVVLTKAGAKVAEINPYDAAVGTLKGLPVAYSPSSPPLGVGEVYSDALVFEAHTSSSITGEGNTFHFLLADGFAKDNRIPPRGFRIAEAAARGAVPAAGGVAAPGLFSAAEYAGGYRDVTVALPASGDTITVELYYQTTSREYVEFLQREINGTSSTLKSPTPSGEPNAYIAQTDAWFGALKPWGDTIFQLWDHNKGVPGAAPILMTRAALALAAGCQGAPDGTPCDDANACTSGDACKGGVCQGGATIACDDNNGCTDDACDPQLGCTHGFNTAPCEDGNPCTVNDVCAWGACAHGGDNTCNDMDSCTNDLCDPMTGCTHSKIPNCGGGGGGMGGATSSASSTSTSTSSSTSTSTSTSTSGGGAPATSSASSGGATTPSDEGCSCSAPGDDSGSRLGAMAAAIAMLAAAHRRRTKRP